MSPFQQSIMGPLLVIGSTFCYRDDYLLPGPLFLETTSCYPRCYRDYLLLSPLLSRQPLVIETTSYYPKHLLLSRHLLLSETPQTTSSCRKHLLLSKGIFVRLRESKKRHEPDNCPALMGPLMVSIFTKHKAVQTWHLKHTR